MRANLLGVAATTDDTETIARIDSDGSHREESLAQIARDLSSRPMLRTWVMPRGPTPANR